ncbi:hypothetical protein U1Q18_016335 [Sarracenia purpurea var. burkii]
MFLFFANLAAPNLPYKPSPPSSFGHAPSSSLFFLCRVSYILQFNKFPSPVSQITPSIPKIKEVFLKNVGLSRISFPYIEWKLRIFLAQWSCSWSPQVLRGLSLSLRRSPLGRWGGFQQPLKSFYEFFTQLKGLLYRVFCIIYQNFRSCKMVREVSHSSDCRPQKTLIDREGMFP